MSAIGSAIPSVLFGHNASVKAWCLTGRNYAAAGTQAAFDAVNFIDGYNLRLDVDTQLTGGIGIQQTNNDLISFEGVNSGALEFTFLTPMPDNKYKVFLQFYRDSRSNNQSTTFAHVLNSSTFPKTRQSFWVRTGLVDTSQISTRSNRLNSVRLGTVGNFNFNLGVVVL